MDNPLIIIAGLIGLVIGAVIAAMFTKKTNKGIVEAAEEKAGIILKEAESKGEILLKDKMLEAKERFFQLKTEH
jgi:ribonuclease Y